MDRPMKYRTKDSGAARLGILGATLVALLGFLLATPAWTAIGRASAAQDWQQVAGDCRDHPAAVRTRALADDAQFLQWAVAVHRASVQSTSFATLAAARALSQDRRN